MRSDKLGNTYTLFGDKIYKRFEIREDTSHLNNEDDDLLYMIYDNEVMIVVSYIGEDELDIGREVVSYMNGLNNSLKNYEKRFDELQGYFGLSELDLIEDNKDLVNDVKYEQGVHALEINYYKDVLKTLLLEYPDSKALWDFKSTVGW